MTKSDLRTGMVVTLRNGNKYTVYLNCHNHNNDHSSSDRLFRDVLVNSSYGHLDDPWLSLCNYNEDLTRKLRTVGDHLDFDIVKVQTMLHPQHLNTVPEKVATYETIWERKEPNPKQMTVAEIEKELGYKVEIVSEK